MIYDPAWLWIDRLDRETWKMSRPGKDGSKRAAKARKRQQKKQDRAKHIASTAVSQQASEQASWNADSMGDVGLPDRRLLERSMWGFPGGGTQTKKQKQADALYKKALQARSVEEQFELAVQAVEIDRDHVDARILVTELYPDPDEALQMARENLRIAERTLGKERLNKDAGHFWGLLETRPYMRARLSLVNFLMNAGKLRDAANHMHDMLRLNPMDNQGVRWLLLEVLVRLGEWGEAEDLLKQYEDDASPTVQFTALLAAIRRKAAPEVLEEKLSEAVRWNEHVVPLLLGEKPLHFGRNGYFTVGGEDEAQLYAEQFLSVWKSTPGAITWLRKAAAKTEAASPSKREDSQETEKRIQKLRRKVKNLPLAQQDVWICDVTRIEEEKGEDGWLVTLLDDQEQVDIWTDGFGGDFDAKQFFEILLLAMLEPGSGEPRRPGRIDFLQGFSRREARRRLRYLEIADEFREDPPEALQMMNRILQARHNDTPLDDLPLNPGETWEVSWQQLGLWMPDPETGEDQQPWMMVAMSTAQDSILGQSLDMNAPSSAEIIGFLSGTMRSPATGNPARPGLVRVRSTEERMMIEAFLEAHSIRCETGEFELMDDMLQGLDQHLGGDSPLSPMIELEGMSTDRIGVFYEAAVDYYRAAPWHTVRPESITEIRCPEIIHGRWYANVMGQMGMECGIMLFDDPDSLDAMFNSDFDDPASAAPDMHGIGFSLGEKHFLAPADVAACDQFGWPVAAPEAWPLAYFVDGGKPRDLSTAELDLLIAALRTVPEFQASQKNETSTEVELLDRTVTVRLARSDF